jgi:hypothetical protein
VEPGTPTIWLVTLSVASLIFVILLVSVVLSFADLSRVRHLSDEETYKYSLINRSFPTRSSPWASGTAGVLAILISVIGFVLNDEDDVATDVVYAIPAILGLLSCSGALLLTAIRRLFCVPCGTTLLEGGISPANQS